MICSRMDQILLSFKQMKVQCCLKLNLNIYANKYLLLQNMPNFLTFFYNFIRFSNFLLAA